MARPTHAVAAVLAGGLVLAVPAFAQSTAVDTVSIELSEGSARVAVSLTVPAGFAEAYAIMVPGQTLEIEEVVGPGGVVEFTLTEESGARRLAVPSSQPVVVRYRVSGVTDRVPLFVPGGGAVLSVAREIEEPWLVRVVGPDVGWIDTDTSMPRFERTDDGTLEVALSSLPSFVRFSSGGPFSFGRLADVFALLLIAVGGGLLLARLRRAANAAEERGAD